MNKKKENKKTELLNWRERAREKKVSIKRLKRNRIE